MDLMLSILGKCGWLGLLLIPLLRWQEASASLGSESKDTAGSEDSAGPHIPLWKYTRPVHESTLYLQSDILVFEIVLKEI